MVRVSRGQLVLATAAVIAAALAPVLLAYLQLGYHADTAAGAEFEDPAANAERVLSRAVYDASVGVPANHSWGQRTDAAHAVRGRLRPRIDRLETARIESGTQIRITYNDTAATAWATTNCPRGEGRQFGPCRTVDGVVLQRRAGEATPLAVGFDVTVSQQRGTTQVTFVVAVVG